MASGVVIDPYALLRAAPLATSTGSLVLATSELIYYSGLVQPPTRKKSDSILAQYWRYVFPRGVSLVLALNVTTIGTSLCNIFLKNPCSRPLPVSRTTFYWAGLMGAIGHLAFVPFVAPPIQRILDNTDPEAETNCKFADQRQPTLPDNMRFSITFGCRRKRQTRQRYESTGKT
ncbi:hypothetical protein APSETT444_009019 [Aspergillus pseudonomiae]